MIASLVAPTITTTSTSNRNSVLTPIRSATTTARREPLKPINMASSRSQARAPSSANGGGKTRRANARVSEDRDDESASEGGRVNGYRHTASAKEERSKKRKADYDERVDDFVFSRAEPKKQKPSAVSSVAFTEQPINEEPEPQPQKQSGQKRKTRAKATDNAASSTPSTRPHRKTSKQNSVEPTMAEDSEEPRRTRRKVEHSDPAPSKTKKKKSKVDETKDPDKAKDMVNGSHTPQQENGGHATTIALPFADTPVISRNKEMRNKGNAKGQRRSSLGMRGRRASSLIESGASNALPHDKVSTADFYKHIGNDGLPEPRRMRQLLTWCATRAIGEKPSGSRSEDESARLAARVIQEELLKDFSNRSELSDWFSREESAPPKVVVKKPNPKNIQNAEKIKELEEQIHQLQQERQSLSALLRPPSIPPITKPLAPPQEQPPQDGERYPASQQRRKPDPDPIDPSLLHPSQHALLNILTPPSPHHHHPQRNQEKQKQRPRHREPPSQQTPSSKSQPEEDTTSSTSHLPPQISSRLSCLTSSLPTTIDAFASGIHDIELYRDSADRVAGRVLGICAKRLEERDQVLGGRWDGDGDGDGDDEDSSSHDHSQSASPSDEMDTGEEGSRNRKRKGKARVRDRGGGGEEDIGLVLGALSRVERR